MPETVALDPIGLQARNKVEKHDHLTREGATRLVAQMTDAERQDLASEPDPEALKRKLLAIRIRLSEAETARLKQQAGQPAQAPPTEEPTSPAEETPGATDETPGALPGQ